MSGGFLYDRELTAGLRDLGNEIHVLALPWRRYAWALTENLNRVRLHQLVELEVDVLLQDELCHPSLFLVNRRLRERMPIVSIVHHLRSSEEHRAPLMYLYRAVERAYLRSVDGFICNSESTRSAIGSLLGKPVSAVVIPPGRDHLRPANAIRPKAGGSAAGGPLRILFVGSLIRRKGLHVLLDALEGLEEAWDLTVVGRPDLEPGYAGSLLSRLNRPPFAGSSHYLGPVESHQLQRLYSQADLLAVPSSHEGFGIVYLEAMGHGLPVLASSAGGASDLVSDDENGYLIEPGAVGELRQALRRYRQSPSLLGRHGRAARARFETHPTWAEGARSAFRYLKKHNPGRKGR